MLKNIDIVEFEICIICGQIGLSDINAIYVTQIRNIDIQFLKGLRPFWKLLVNKNTMGPRLSDV